MSNIYMEYLTESEREELILEKEVELLLIDNDYLHESSKINIPKLQKLNDTIFL